MFELLKSLTFAIMMAPVVMTLILGAVYGMGGLFNVISKIGQHKNVSDPSRQ